MIISKKKTGTVAGKTFSCFKTLHLYKYGRKLLHGYFEDSFVSSPFPLNPFDKIKGLGREINNRVQSQTDATSYL